MKRREAVDGGRLRAKIYEWFATTGQAPDLSLVTSRAGGETAARAQLRRLHAAHSLVLAGDDSIRMALPFSAVPTEHVVTAAAKRWWANCAWDSLAIPAALRVDATIEARWLDDDSPTGLAVVEGRPNTSAGFIHFAIPARLWWDDIVETRLTIRFLRSEENRPEVGECVPLTIMWPLTPAWYGDRTDPDYAPRPTEYLQRLLTTVGLTGSFWRLD